MSFIIVPVVLYGCQAWSFVLREEHRLRVFEDRVLRRIFGPKRGEATGSGEDYITRNLMTCEMEGHLERRVEREMHTGFWRGNLREGDHLGDPGIDGRIVLKWVFKKWDGGSGLA
jgi:hypothetical protein